MNLEKTAEDIKKLLETGMGLTLHWFPEDVSSSKLAETMVGMANTEGGRVFIGVSPRSAQITGVSRIEPLMDRIFEAAFLADPPLIIPVPTIHKTQDAILLEILVPTGLPNVYSLDGRYFCREGRHTAPISPRNLRNLLIKRGVVSIESRSPEGATLQDLDPDQVQAYLQAVQLTGVFTPEESLLRRGCLVSDGTTYRPTYAGLLLFGRYPQQWLPSATILAARFSGSTFGDIFVKQDIRGALPNQIRQAEQFLQDHLRSVVQMKGLVHEATPEYPPEATRELIVNAIAHRDYNNQGDTIHLHIFQDRLEVHSPGALPGPMNLDNLLQARYSRNPVIVQVLSDLGFVERLGYGLNRVMAAMHRGGFRPPRFEEVAGSFRVTLLGETILIKSPESLEQYQHFGLNPRQELAIGYLTKKPRITSRDYQDLCPEVHPETLRRDLAAMVDMGILIKIGDKRATYYILKKVA